LAQPSHESSASASPLRWAPSKKGCLTGCIIGGGLFENFARIYGATRTGTTSSWRGKCFAEAAAVRPTPLAGATTIGYDEWQPGVEVTNRIKFDYGPRINRWFNLEQPRELYPGKVYTGNSLFAEGERAVIIDCEGRRRPPAPAPAPGPNRIGLTAAVSLCTFPPCLQLCESRPMPRDCLQSSVMSQPKPSPR